MNINKMIEKFVNDAINLCSELDSFCAEDARDVSVSAIESDDLSVIKNQENYNIMCNIVDLVEKLQKY